MLLFPFSCSGTQTFCPTLAWHFFLRSAASSLVTSAIAWEPGLEVLAIDKGPVGLDSFVEADNSCDRRN